MQNDAIIVAIIGLVGVLANSLMANWDKLFPKRLSQTAELKKTGAEVLERNQRLRRTHRRNPIPKS